MIDFSAASEQSLGDGQVTLKPGFVCPMASADQQLLLDGLNDDVLAILLDILSDLDRSDVNWLGNSYVARHCSTFRLSLVNRRLRLVCNHRLFREVYCRAKTMRRLNRKLEDIENSGHVLSCIRTCEIFVDSKDDSMNTRLPIVLAAMTRLTKLSITHPQLLGFSALEETFGRSNIFLPSVVGLRIECPGNWYFLVDACPNTEKLGLYNGIHDDEMLNSAGALSKLECFEIYSGAWDSDEIHRLLDTVPHIHNLTLKGKLFSLNLLSLAEILAKSEDLLTLAITLHHMGDVEQLGGGGEDGEGEDYGTIADAFFERCTTLERLYLVYFWPTLYTRCSDGYVEEALVDCDGYPEFLSFSRDDKNPYPWMQYED